MSAEALKARLRVRVETMCTERMLAEDEAFAGDPPEDIHFRCGSCFRQGRVVKAEVFSYTPLPEGRSKDGRASPRHTLEGRCFECSIYFKGRLLKYDVGRRVLWAKFCRETSERVMNS